MAFRFSVRSLENLSTVHEDMQRLAHRAIEITPVDFTVIQGLRTRDQQAKLYGKGRTAAQMRAMGLPLHYAQPNTFKVTWTMNSNHMSGRAIDVAPWVPGRGLVLPDRPTQSEIQLFRDIADAFKRAGMELCIVVEWGGDWKSTKDYPHIELARA